jgi:UDP-glucose:(heptosyl)LPS alpha-1,3-glucosyltransferase
MERAAVEVITRLKREHHVVVFSRVCELDGENYEWVPVQGRSTYSAVYGLTFARAARKAAARAGCAITYSVGAASLDADIVISQFCHSAFVKQHGGIRGGGNALRRSFHYLAQRGDALLERRTYRSRRMRRVLAVSTGVANDVVEHYGVAQKAIRIVPNGVDPQIFRPASSADAKSALRHRLGLPDSGLLALFLGGDWHRKGLADVIEAVGKLPDVSLVVVGKGDAVAFGEIAEQAGARERVFFVAHTAQPQEYYAAADVFAFPSRYEAFSLATLEAAAAGLPLLTMRINGTEELVEDGVTGYFVGAGSADLLRRLMELRDPELRARMGAAAIGASRRYTWDAIGQQHLDTVNELAAEGDLPR